MNLVPAQVLGIPTRDGALAGVRPHDISLGTGGRPTLTGSASVEAVVELVEPRGHDAVVHLRLDTPGTPAVLAVVDTQPPAVGSRLRVSFPTDRIHVFDAPNGARLRQ